MLIEEEDRSIWYMYDHIEWSKEEENNQTTGPMNHSLAALEAATTRLSLKYKTSSLIMYSILGLITFASLLIILLLGSIFKKNPSLMHNSVNIFILNIIFVDLLRCLIHAPIYSLSIHLSFDEFTSRYDDPSNNYLALIVVCNLNTTLSVLFEIEQLLSFLAISYERFKIVHSPFLNANKRVVLAKLLLLFTWFLSICLSAAIVFLVSYISEYKNFSAQSKSCYLDVYRLALDIYYNPLSQEVKYDEGELRLRNRQNDCIDYFNLTISLLAFALSGYFYTRIILFLKFHEKKLFSTMNKIEPAAVISSSQSFIVDGNQSTGTIPVLLVAAHSSHIKEEMKGEHINVVISSSSSSSSSVQLANHLAQPDSSQISLKSIKTKFTLDDVNKDPISQKSESIGERQGEVEDKISKCGRVIKRELIKLEGEVCILSSGNNNNGNKGGRRRLEVRTAKKTFTIMLSFLSCQLIFLFSILIHKLPLFSQNALVVEQFHAKFFAFTQLGIYFTIFSYLSCFFNSFTFILVTDLFKAEALCYMRRVKRFLLDDLKTVLSR